LPQCALRHGFKGLSVIWCALLETRTRVSNGQSIKPIKIKAANDKYKALQFDVKTDYPNNLPLVGSDSVYAHGDKPKGF
jgi:hypothetical protein